MFSYLTVHRGWIETEAQYKTLYSKTVFFVYVCVMYFLRYTQNVHCQFNYQKFHIGYDPDYECH